MKFPKCDPQDIDPYTTLQRLLRLEDRMSALETDVGENEVESVVQSDDVHKLKNMVDTHEMLISGNLLPSQPTYAAMVASGNNAAQRQVGTGGSLGDGTAGLFPRVGQGGNRPGRHNQSRTQLNQHQSYSVPSGDQTRPQSVGDPRSDDGGQWSIVGHNGRSQSRKPHRNQHKIQGCAQSQNIHGAPPPKREFFIS